MSRSLHVTAHHRCPFDHTRAVGTVCVVGLLDHPGGRCRDRSRGHHAAAVRNPDGRVVRRRAASTYARRWYRDELSQAERADDRSTRRRVAEALRGLSGPVDHVAAVADEVVEALEMRRYPGLEHDVC